MSNTYLKSIFDEVGKSRSQFATYADKYNCTLDCAFRDRSEPMTADDIIKAWKEASGNDITDSELELCAPDCSSAVKYERSLYDD